MNAATNELAWLEILLAYGYQFADKEGWITPEMDREDRRAERVRQFMDVLRPTPETEGDIRWLAVITAGWMAALPQDVTEHRFSPVVRATMAQFNKLPPAHLVEKANEVLARNDAHPRLALDGSRGLVFEMPQNGNVLKSMILAPWFEFVTTDTRRIHFCPICEKPFHVQRNDTKTCSATCRSTLRRRGGETLKRARAAIESADKTLRKNGERE